MPDFPARFSLTGKRALVTGGSRGIGAEIAAVLADAGADVALTGRDAAGLAATRAAVVKHGHRCVTIEADLATPDGPRIAAEQALDFFGTIDILINNAGIFHREPLLETTLAHWDETLAVNLRAPLLLAQAIAPGMIAQKRGKIINISSLASLVGVEGHASYSSSKGGLNLLTQVMAAEWGPHNIQTNAIAPAIVLTDMARAAWGDEAKSAPVKARIPCRRFGEPREVADLVLYLASSASDYICGQVLPIDGGYSAV
jgi:NAD(P)-dependent dehydrogenase (short-subunit alcohol dehydrogenase family)